MSSKKLLFLCMVFVFLFNFPMGLFAQDDLTQTYISPDGKFSINYPAGWTLTEERGGPVRFNGDAGFLQVSFYDNKNSGYAPVTALELLEVGIGEDADLRAAKGFVEPEALIIAGFPAVQSGGNLLGELHTVIDYGDGVLCTVVGFASPGNLAAAEPTFTAMMNSIQYGNGPQPIAESPIDNVAAITAANASQITKLMTLWDESVSVESLAFNWDDRLLAIGTADGSVQLWDVATGETRFTLQGHTGGVTSVAFGAGGYLLAVGNGSGQVRLWDTASGEPSGMLQRHDAAVTSVAFQADGFLVASGAADGSVKVWDMISASELPALAEADQTPIGSLAFNLEGTLLVAGGGGRLRVWNTTDWSLAAELETKIVDISSLSFRPDGTALVYGGADPAVWVWDLADSNQVLLGGHVGTVTTLVFSLDGSLIASADAESVRLWDASTGANLATLASLSNSVAFKPDGTILASSGPSSGVVLWGTSSAGDTTQTTIAPETSTIITSTASCTFTAPGEVNLRSGPGTTFDRAGALSTGETTEVDGQAQGTDGMTWYRLVSGAWVRSDVVAAPAACATVQVVTG